MPPPSDANDDNVLAMLARDGQHRALDTLVRRHAPEVSRLLWRFARNHADLEDLVQDTFLRVVKHLPGWRAEQPFVHWLRRITVNVGRDHWRRENTRRRWSREPGPPDSDARAPEPVDPGSDAGARAAANEIKSLLDQLPPNDRTLLTLHHLEGWDFAEIGRELGWSAPVTKVRAFRARRRLRDLILSLDNPS